MKYLKIVCSDFANKSRDKRELSVAQEMGMEICVVAKGEKSQDCTVDIEDGYKVIRYTTRYLGENNRLALLNRIFSIFLWSSRIRKLKPDVISGHDITGYIIGYLSILFKRKKNKPKLVYDAHEFEIGRNAKRGFIKKRIIALLEKFVIKTSDLTIVVNDSIADKIQEIYLLKEKPLSIRNIPVYYQIDNEKCKMNRNRFLKSLQLDEKTFLLMYHGGICKGRGIERFIEIIAETTNIAGIIMGFGEQEYIDELHQLCVDKEVDTRILFVDAVPQKELGTYVGAVDLEWILIPRICDSYYYMLPNKFFESIQSVTPLLVPNYPEVSFLVKKYDIGFICNVDQKEEIIAHINELKEHKEIQDRFKKNLLKAKEELCWEKEKQKLIAALSKTIFGEYRDA